MTKTLAINAGSSSLKWKLYEMPEEKEIASGIVERVGLTDSIFKIRTPEKALVEEVSDVPTHEDAVRKLLEGLEKKGIIHSLDEITGVGHRVVAGGEIFKNSTRIDEKVIRQIRKLSDLAPLHNPPNATGVEIFYKLLPETVSVAVFDTSFHQSMQPVQYLYSIPLDFYEKYHARKYGAHGISHQYVAERTSEIVKKPLEELKVITCHLGNGSSLTAVDGGKSIDTSMGFTPLAGVTMGTRSGDLDVSLLPYLMEKTGVKNIEEMITILNTESGLKGLSGISSDMRDIKKEEKTNERAALAINIFIDRIKKYIGAYAALMNGVDAIVFTAGIGEHNPWLRERIISGVSFLGISIDSEKNERAKGDLLISSKDSKVAVLKIDTDEEIMIAREVEKFKNEQ